VKIQDKMHMALLSKPLFELAWSQASCRLKQHRPFLPILIPEMPPKRRRQAKAGAILSGISRAGPGEVDIGSMVPRGESNISRNHQELLQHASTTLSNMLGVYCHMCCDAIQPGFQHQCINCSALICEQFVPRSSGCITHGSVVCSKEEFLCPICARTGQKDLPLPYGYSGFGRRKKVKMEWPMCVVNLNVEPLEEGYLAAVTKVELMNHYKSQTSNVGGSDLLSACNTNISSSCSFTLYL
jgi:hypothetical protein